MFTKKQSPAQRLLERQRRRNLGLPSVAHTRSTRSAYAHVAQPVESEVPDTSTELRIGHYGGPCNMTVCRKSGATWWNRGSYSHYCEGCARMLNRVNFHDAEELLGKGEKLCIEVKQAGNRPFGKTRYI